MASDFEKPDKIHTLYKEEKEGEATTHCPYTIRQDDSFSLLPH